MPLQNRVDPFGDLKSVDEKGALLGNRGILHDDKKHIKKLWAHKNWVTCKLEFKGIKRSVFSPNHYSELFFLDEATSFSAGHRPCAHCRNDRYNEFKSYWRSMIGGNDVSAPNIDKQLHSDRLDLKKDKAVFSCALVDVPEGAFISIDGNAYLLWSNALYLWSFNGYTKSSIERDLSTLVDVLTPRSIVELYKLGFKPEVHASVS